MLSSRKPIPYQSVQEGFLGKCHHNLDQMLSKRQMFESGMNEDIVQDTMLKKQQIMQSHQKSPAGQTDA